MGDNEEMLIMDLITLQFTLQHLGWHYFVELAGEKKKKNSAPHTNLQTNYSLPLTYADRYVLQVVFSTCR